MVLNGPSFKVKSIRRLNQLTPTRHGSQERKQKTKGETSVRRCRQATGAWHPKIFNQLQGSKKKII